MTKKKQTTTPRTTSKKKAAPSRKKSTAKAKSTVKKTATTKQTPVKKVATKKATTKKRTPAPATKKPATRTTKKPTSRKPVTSATRKRAVKKEPVQAQPHNPHQKYLVAGVGLILVTAIVLLSLLSPNQGTLTPIVAGWMRQLFGLGSIMMPLIMGALGVYLILVGIESRPKISPYRILGASLLFIVIEAIASLWVFMRDFPNLWKLAENGLGGGYFGSFFAYPAALLVGDLGGIILYALVGVIAFMLLLAIAPARIGRRLQTIFGAGDSHAEISDNPAPLDRQPRLPMFGRKQAAEPVPDTREPAAMREVIRQDQRRVDEIRRKRQAAAATAGFSNAPEAVPEPPAPVAEKKRDWGIRQPKKDKAPVPAKPVLPEEQTQLGQWAMPELSRILDKGYDPETDDDLIREQATVIEETLASFGAPGNIVDVQRGPTVTQFGVEPGYLSQRSGKRSKVKVSKIAGLADDLALALAAKSVRIQAPVPGKGYIGIEVPSTSQVIVSLRDVMETQSFSRISSPLRIGLGQDVAGNAISADLAKMPHLLVAGATGSGKSVCVNAIIACLLLQNSPNDLRFVMVDPKRVELTGYNSIPHMAAPVVVDMDKVIGVLMWALREMDSRYQAFAKAGARNIITYNKKMEKSGGDKLPYIVIIIDELADLMMTAPEDTERALARLAQMARATGMHMIIATQRPSVDVVTGLIKANFPARIAFAVSSSTDSRVILDQVGAERLLGQGDMLLQKPDAPTAMRMQGCYVSDEELNKLIRYWKSARRTNTYTGADAEPKPQPDLQPQGVRPSAEIPQPAFEKPAPEQPAPEKIVTVKQIEVDRVVAQDRSLDVQSGQTYDAPHRMSQERPPAPVLNESAEPEPSYRIQDDEIEADDTAEAVETEPFTPLHAPVAAAPVKHLLDIEAENQEERDELWQEAVTFVRERGSASTSMLQRKFRIGYTRAARMIDYMEDDGIIGPPTGTSKAREVVQ